MLLVIPNICVRIKGASNWGEKKKKEEAISLPAILKNLLFASTKIEVSKELRKEVVLVFH